MTTKQLELLANDIRQDIIIALTEAKSGHSGGPLGMADIFTALYFEIVNITPKTRHNKGRDRVVLSNAHICPVLYATLARAGFCSREQFLTTLRKLDSPFQGHSNNHFDMGIETCGGPLAQGLSQAVGMALAARMQRANWRTYAVTGDGELNEGQCWEAFMLAGKEHLDNLIVTIDRNHIQIDGPTESVMPLEPLADKLRAFQWQVIDVDGHSMPTILSAYAQAQQHTGSPVAIIAHTVPGKGVSFMEGRYEWHGKVPTPHERELALADLSAIRHQIQAS